MRMIDQKSTELGGHGLGRVLVVGLGNRFAGDDGVGPAMVPLLREKGLYPSLVIELPHMDVIEILDEADTIVFVDAVVSGLPPGTVHLIPLPDPEIESRNGAAFSLHGWGLNEALDLRRSLGLPCPRMFLLGIEIESAEPGTELSDVVRNAVKVVAESFPLLLKRLQDGTAPRFWPSDALAYEEGDVYVAHQT